jgi:hypothetical protein
MKVFSTRVSRWLFTAGALLSLAGCGGTGQISGKVTLDGQPLPGGLVTVYDAEGVNNSGMIGKDGSYSVANIPLGKVEICIATAPPSPGINPNNPPRAQWGEYKKIPDKYKEKGKSGFSLDVKKGAQTLDLPLVDDQPKP